MWRQIRDVEEFHRKLGFYVGDRPGIPPLDVRERRNRIIKEEHQELMEELTKKDPKLKNIVAEGIDNLYVIHGMFMEHGIDPTYPWDLVHGANMTKVPNPQGGKAIKPEGWIKPDTHTIILMQSISKWRIRWRSVWRFKVYAFNSEEMTYEWGFHIGPLEVIRRKKNSHLLY